ncbi:MAG TPA: flagellar basal body L-ring protein FlgH [Candidatus Acidoferrum sp.]|jgi:flagellar L-ring protein precursor FlgH
MTPTPNPLRKLAAALLVTGLLVFCSSAQPRDKKPKPDATTTLVDDYLKRARAMNTDSPSTPGSLWVSTGALASLALDYRALNAGDLIVIHLTDTLTAANAGENSQTRAFSAQSGITGLIGKIGTRNRLQNLFGGSSTTSLDGKGSSTLSSSVTVNLSAQVIEVLPNGVLVVQAARDMLIGNDRQTIVLHGLVRPGDLAVDNSIASSSVGNLEVEIKGKGAVADATRQPNIVVRLLMKILTF